jgi:hypothetical protein
MTLLTQTRRQLHLAIDDLPAEALPELTSFLDYLRFKTSLSPLVTEQSEQPAVGSAFLLSIAGIGASTETDLSERDEEILTNEIDPLRGWGLPRQEQP